MRIGELSKVTGVSIATIRLYEREGLIDFASRTEGGFREFTPEQTKRLGFIKRVRNLGFSLDDVKALLSLVGSGQETRSELLERISREITTRQNDLDRLAKSLLAADRGSISFGDLEAAFHLKDK